LIDEVLSVTCTTRSDEHNNVARESTLALERIDRHSMTADDCEAMIERIVAALTEFLERAV
jgi:hypothetical protein